MEKRSQTQSVACERKGENSPKLEIECLVERLYPHDRKQLSYVMTALRCRSDISMQHRPGSEPANPFGNCSKPPRNLG
eukprot:2523371-Amphidinium_carterae.2